MTEIIQRWIQDRLGVLVNMAPEDFADSVRDGHLLAAILKSYEIITHEQLEMIDQSNSPEICLVNFKEHLLIWLGAMGINLEDEEVFEIVNGKGTAAINLFYLVYLELAGNSNLYFITEQRLREKLRPPGRFIVQRVKEGLMQVEDSPTRAYDMPLREAQDIVHWQKDKMQMLQAKCKEARETYLQYIKLNQAPRKKMQRMSWRSERFHGDTVANEDAVSVNLTYQELVRQQDVANRAPRFAPDPQKTRLLMKKFRVKKREHGEHLIFKSELQRDIFTNFWDRLKKEEEDRLNKNVVEVVIKQSLYEKQVHQKIGEVKLQKHVMLENKRNEAYAISKQMEEDFAQRLVMKEKEMGAQELTYYLEKERLAHLHTKMYEHKLQTRKLVCGKICMEAVEDLVKLACHEAEWRKVVGEDVPRRVRNTWKRMFTNVVPLDSYITPTEVILLKPEERPDELEEIIHLEIERQEKIDENDLERYLRFEWPWSLDNVELEERNLDDMSCGMNVLGNIVHNLLAVKYPLPPLPPRPDFPNIKVSACVNGLDTNCLPTLREILNLRQILVVEIQDCVDYCVRAFVQESTVEADDADEENKKIKKGKEKKKEKGGPKSEKKARKGSKTKVVVASVTDDEPAPDKKLFADKTVQTPVYYPVEEMPLTKKAELGKMAHEVLEKGEPLTDFILAAMFVEYLQSKPEIEGWVLINFPKTYDEAAVLEENLTGLPVPRLEDDPLDPWQNLMEMTELEEKPSTVKEGDEFELSRRSRVLPQPVAPKDPEFYDTALTAYIKVTKKNTEREKRESLEDSVEDTDPLEKFYADLGCNYQFYYNRIDFGAIKSLAKLIVGDFSIPPKSSVEIFGEAVNHFIAGKDQTAQESVTTAKKGEKKQKPKEKKPKRKSVDTPRKEASTERRSKSNKSDAKAGKGKAKGKKGKSPEQSTVVIVREDKYTQAPEPEEESEEDEEKENDVEPANQTNPGELGWPYIELPLPETLQIAIATLWENTEEVYLIDLEQVFFMKRLILNAIIPFVDSVKAHMAEYMNKPDEKQKYMREFQRSYNEFDDDYRNDADFKAEMHCRIHEMREKLVEICDWKMIASDHERVFIIEKNWTSRQLIQLTNNFVSAMQLELDRFTDTIMLLCDYYTSMVSKMPSNMLLSKDMLPKLELENPQTTKALNSLLQTVDDSEEVVLHQFMQTVIDKCFNFVDATQPSIRSAMRKVKDMFDEANKTKEKAKASIVKDKKSEKPSVSIPVHVETEYDEELLKLSPKIIDEWSCAVRGETVRVKIRLQLLQADLLRSVGEVLSTVRKIFYDIYEQIRTTYRKELKNINNACKVLAIAAEREVKIQEELLLDRGDFNVDPEVMLFLDELPPVRPLEESVRTGVFTINQLDKLVDILLDLSPSGYMPERSFLYLLQDLIVSKDDPILVPQLWRKLQPRDVDKVSKYLFDDVEYVTWKDFIVYNLMVKFPSIQEILDLRTAFRALDPDGTELIYDYQFSEIKFWFEQGVEDELRLKLMRQLLFKMYRVKENTLNYTALLLDFCKDEKPAAGLAKALTVSLGEPVCWNKTVGEHFIEMSRRKKLYEELRLQRKQELKGGKEVAEQILAQLVEDVLDLCKKREELGPDFDKQEEEQKEIEDPEDESDDDSFGTNIKMDIEPVAELAYFLPIEVLMTVITTCLPWHARVANIEDKSFMEMAEDLYAKCKHRKFNYHVLCHEFLNHPVFTRELSKTNKFTAKNPVAAVEEALMERQEERGRKAKKH